MYRKIKSILIKAFVGGDWKVAYRTIGEKEGQYQIVETPRGTWAADPFLYETNGEHYLFVELCIKKKDKGLFRHLCGLKMPFSPITTPLQADWTFG